MTGGLALFTASVERSSLLGPCLFSLSSAINTPPRAIPGLSAALIKFSFYFLFVYHHFLFHQRGDQQQGHYVIFPFSNYLLCN
ncbi:hypothetical protein BDZ91DRAFT_735337 [Kalaharituber pfeilii]|nr:hypothetical protein BDZ91DRAFT_735337 [Kalaharituber pfeilii]